MNLSCLFGHDFIDNEETYSIVVKNPIGTDFKYQLLKKGPRCRVCDSAKGFNTKVIDYSDYLDVFICRIKNINITKVKIEKTTEEIESLKHYLKQKGIDYV